MSGAAAVGAARARKAHRGASRNAWPFWAALLPTLVAIAGFGAVYSYVWAPVDVALFAALAVYAWSRALHGGGLDLPPLIWPMAAFGALVLAQWALPLSVYPGATLTGLVQLTGCGAVFLLMVQACRKTQAIRWLGYILWLFCGLLAMEAIFQAFGANGYIFWFHNATYATPVGPFVYHNFYAGCMDLLLPVATLYAFRVEISAEPPWSRWLRRGLVPAAALASVVIAKSRGGVLVLLAEAVLGVWIFWPDLKRRRGGRRALLAGGVLLLGFSVLANWGPLVQRFATLENHDPSAVDRIHMAESSWHMFLAHPWYGTGFNTFATVYPAYQTFDNGLNVVYAHDDYAQLLAETGVAGAISASAFLLLWGMAFWRRRASREGDGLVRNLQLGGFIGTAGFLIHSVGDFQFHAPGNALLFFLLAAASVAPARRPKAVPKTARREDGDHRKSAGAVVGP